MLLDANKCPKRYAALVPSFVTQCDKRMGSSSFVVPHHEPTLPFLSGDRVSDRTLQAWMQEEAIENWPSPGLGGSKIKSRFGADF